MAENYVLLETIELTQSAASVTFDNIPQTGYTDLVIKWSARSNRSAVTDPMRIGFNGSTSSFTNKYLSGNSSSAISGSSARYLGEASGNTATASTFANGEIVIPNYAGSNNKSASSDNVSENNSGGSGDAVATFAATLWSNSAAITSVELTLDTGPLFMQHSTFSLYGVAAFGTTPVLAPQATGGNIVANDGTYWYHTFTSSGTFTPQTGLTCDYLVVAGGGGGGLFYSGGGGAGGLLYATNSSLTLNTNYTVTIGAGGAAAGTAGTGSNGSNSVFGSSTALGGGFGGMFKTSNPQIAAGSGGSGGGGAGYDNNLTAPYYKAGGAATQGNSGGATGYGNTGGQGYYPSNFNPAAGGGGGAGAVGGDGTNSAAGNGGIGRQYDISGTNTYYAGGGGGSGENRTRGTGGSGGGGNGAQYQVAFSSAGSANTGGGGGGGVTTANDYFGSAGGSGIVIIRYAMV